MLRPCEELAAGARIISYSIDMEGRPRGGGGGGWSRPPAPPATEATRAAGRGAAHQQQQVKVKHIVTREVSTDQASFKDVAAARAAVVAGGASWSAGSTSGAVSSGSAAVFEDNAVAGAMLPPEEDMRRPA